MKAISLKLNEDLFSEVDTIIKEIHIPRNSYINKALMYYNRAIKRKLLKAQYHKESSIVSEHSLEINREFQEIEDEILGI